MDSLVKRAMEHDVNAFAQLMEENTGSMYKVARCFLKNDEDIADAVKKTRDEYKKQINTLLSVFSMPFEQVLAQFQKQEAMLTALLDVLILGVIFPSLSMTAARMPRCII